MLDQHVTELVQEEVAASILNKNDDGTTTSSSSSSSSSNNNNNSLATAQREEEKAQSKALEKKIKAYKKKHGPKNSMNSYMFFALPRRTILMKENPEMSGNVGALSKILGEEWRGLTAEEKVQYQNQAIEDKVRYEREEVAFQPQLQVWIDGGMVTEVDIAKQKKNKEKKEAAEAEQQKKEADRVPLKSSNFDTIDFESGDFKKQLGK